MVSALPSAKAMTPEPADSARLLIAALAARHNGQDAEAEALFDDAEAAAAAEDRAEATS